MNIIAKAASVKKAIAGALALVALAVSSHLISGSAEAVANTVIGVAGVFGIYVSENVDA